MNRLDKSTRNRLTERKQGKYMWTQFALGHTKGEVGDLLCAIIGPLEDSGLRIGAIHDLPAYASLGTVEEIRTGLDKRVVEPKKRYNLQVTYEGQDSYIVDTVIFTVPDDTTPAAFENACESAGAVFSASEYRDLDQVDVTTEMLDSIAAELNGTWEMMDIMTIISVDDDGDRKMSR